MGLTLASCSRAESHPKEKPFGGSGEIIAAITVGFCEERQHVGIWRNGEQGLECVFLESHQRMRNYPLFWTSVRNQRTGGKNKTRIDLPGYTELLGRARWLQQAQKYVCIVF